MTAPIVLKTRSSTVVRYQVTLSKNSFRILVLVLGFSGAAGGLVLHLLGAC